MEDMKDTKPFHCCVSVDVNRHGSDQLLARFRHQDRGEEILLETMCILPTTKLIKLPEMFPMKRFHIIFLS